jgi:hypothetical protein
MCYFYTLSYKHKKNRFYYYTWSGIKSLIKKDPSPKTQNPRTKNQDLLFSPFGIWSLEYRSLKKIQVPKPKTQELRTKTYSLARLEFGAWNLELGIWNLELGI